MLYCLLLVIENRGKIKTTNSKITTEKLRKVCHRNSGYRHSNNMRSLFVKVFSRIICQMVEKLIVINFKGLGT